MKILIICLLLIPYTVRGQNLIAPIPLISEVTFIKNRVKNIFSRWEETFNKQIVRARRNPLNSRKVLLTRLDEKEITKKIFENLNLNLSDQEKTILIF